MVQIQDRDELLAQTGQWMHHLGFRGELGASMAEQIVDFLVSNEPLAHPAVPSELTAAEKADAREIFEGNVADRSACHFCTGLHDRVEGLPSSQQPCPRIKRIKRHIDGVTVLDVEHWPPGTWETDVVFPGDVYDGSEEDD